jgi:hypothetical protein
MQISLDQIPNTTAARTGKEAKFAIRNLAIQKVQHLGWVTAFQPFLLGHAFALRLSD